MTSQKLRAHCQLGSEAKGRLRMSVSELNSNAHPYNHILKVVRTTVDLPVCAQIEAEQIAEAIQYRTLDRILWE